MLPGHIKELENNSRNRSDNNEFAEHTFPNILYRLLSTENTLPTVLYQKYFLGMTNRAGPAAKDEPPPEFLGALPAPNNH